MSICEEQAECPLCMEPFDIDDISFYPCTCGYQICRFCWHRIRTNENGLCPACRKAYPENPAEFKPLTDDEVHKIKKDRRQKETQRKQKSAECRKHLANVRVVQKNLVFVVGLSPRLCDAEILRRHEYFGKFGKIHKVVINQSTSYVGSQGPSASAYVTYFRPEDALAAIRTVNNLQIDGRTLKASLGTTKYCSHFLKGTQCQKPDCMYLHDYGDEAASFTKEEIQQGKHLVYEQKLHDQFGPLSTTSSISPEPMSKQIASKTKESSPPGSGQLSPVGLCVNPSPPNQNSPTVMSSGDGSGFPDHMVNHSAFPEDHLVNSSIRLADGGSNVSSLSSSNDSTSGYSSGTLSGPTTGPLASFALVPPTGAADHNLSLFSDCGFPSARHPSNNTQQQTSTDQIVPHSQENPPSDSADDWQGGSLGLSSTTTNNNTLDSLSQDDDLGFDPWDVSARALADLIEKEKVNSYRPPQHLPPPLPVSIPPSQPMNSMYQFHRLKLLPPGFTPNGLPPNLANMRPPHFFPHMAALQHQQHRSRMLSMMQSVAAAQQSACVSQPPGSPRMMAPPFTTNHVGAPRNLFSNPSESSSGMLSDSTFFPRPPANDVYNWRDWQENFKALLPNVNISFGTPPHSSFSNVGGARPLGQSNGFLPSQTSHHGMHHTAPSDKSWSSRTVPDLSWDPAIINTGDVTTADSLNDDVPPHWMASIHHLTEDNHMGSGGTSAAVYGQSPNSPSNSWIPQQLPSNSRLLPPGFGLTSPARPGPVAADSQLFGEHQLSAS